MSCRSSVIGVVCAALLIAAIVPVTVAAHDLWIEPSAFTPRVGEIVPLRLRVGQDLLGDPLARDGRLIRDFVIADADGRRPVVGRDGADPAGMIRVASDGLAVVGYYSTPSLVTLTAEKFAQYLAEEGLEHIAATRQRAGQSGEGARDAFTRCAKSLILTGPASATQRDRVLGFPLELTAERNPYALGADPRLPVQLTWQGRPLAGALVVAINRRNPAAVQRLRTDRQGRVSFTIAGDGLWLLKAVHMEPAAAGSQADWESYWASLTFAAPDHGARQER